MFWKNWSWPTRILSVLFVGLVVAVLFPIFARPPEHPGPSYFFQNNLRQIGLGLLQYTQDYDDKFPPVAARGSAYGWADALYPYTKSIQLFQCPSESNEGQTNPRLSGYTDYWFNARLSKRAIGTVGESARLIEAGDGNDGTDVTNARYSIAALPSNWISDQNSPLYRHLGAANYLFADGHVKSMKPSTISSTWNQRRPFFEPKEATG